tara:strand:- start:615 stop:923 length:309 start_codon:yes stop_codon:yes gene_type:complete
MFNESTKGEKMIKYIAHSKKWRDKINGNTYFSVQITDLKNNETMKVPFQYGYGDHFKSITLNQLCKKDNTSKFSLYHDFIKWIDEKDCKKKDVLNWGGNNES